MSEVRRIQSGITLIGFLIVLIVLGFFAFLFMKLYPAYYEYYNVVTAMEAIKKEPAVARWTPADILKSLDGLQGTAIQTLDKRMYINYVDEKFVNKRSFQIKKISGGYLLTVKYERREPVVYNLDYVAKFERTVQLGSKMGTN